MSFSTESKSLFNWAKDYDIILLDSNILIAKIEDLYPFKDNFEKPTKIEVEYLNNYYIITKELSKLVVEKRVIATKLILKEYSEGIEKFKDFYNNKKKNFTENNELSNILLEILRFNIFIYARLKDTYHYFNNDDMDFIFKISKKYNLRAAAFSIFILALTFKKQNPNLNIALFTRAFHISNFFRQNYDKIDFSIFLSSNSNYFEFYCFI